MKDLGNRLSPVLDYLGRFRKYNKAVPFVSQYARDRLVSPVAMLDVRDTIDDLLISVTNHGHIQ